MDETLYRIARARRTSSPPLALDLLLDSRSAEDPLVRDGLFSLLTAAQEGTAATLAFVLYLLARHPHAARALQTEVDGVLGGRTPTAADVESLPFMDTLFKEAWRLYPPSWITTRAPRESTTIGPYRIAAGAMVAVSPYALHRDPRWFPEPEAFRPDRWTPEFERELPRGCWLPFGAGPHTCIGRSFGVLESRLILALLVQRARVEPLEHGSIALSAGITLRPRKLRLAFHARAAG